jgi:hypothetical protein
MAKLYGSGSATLIYASMVCWTLRSPAARAVQAVTSHNFPALGVKTDLQGHTTTCLKYAILILVIFVAQQLYECLGQLNFVWNIPIHRGTKCNCPQVSSSKGKAGGTQFVLVLYNSLRSSGKWNLASRLIFVARTLFQRLGWRNFGWKHPNAQSNKMQLSPDP